MNHDPAFFDLVMNLAGAMSRLSQAVEALTGDNLEHVTVDAIRPSCATIETHPILFRKMWRWGTFSGVVIWSPL